MPWVMSLAHMLTRRTLVLCDGACYSQENTLLDNSKRPLVKMCDFGYSKHAKDSLPKSKVGTPGYTGRLCSTHI